MSEQLEVGPLRRYILFPSFQEGREEKRKNEEQAIADSLSALYDLDHPFVFHKRTSRSRDRQSEEIVNLGNSYRGRPVICIHGLLHTAGDIAKDAELLFRGGARALITIAPRARYEIDEWQFLVKDNPAIGIVVGLYPLFVPRTEAEMP